MKKRRDSSHHTCREATNHYYYIASSQSTRARLDVLAQFYLETVITTIRSLQIPAHPHLHYRQNPIPHPPPLFPVGSDRRRLRLDIIIVTVIIITTHNNYHRRPSPHRRRPVPSATLSLHRRHRLQNDNGQTNHTPTAPFIDAPPPFQSASLNLTTHAIFLGPARSLRIQIRQPHF
jgi:hypothetical protein